MKLIAITAKYTSVLPSQRAGLKREAFAKATEWKFFHFSRFMKLIIS